MLAFINLTCMLEAPESRRPSRLIASTCGWDTSNAYTSTSPPLARCAANRLPIAPHPTMRTFFIGLSRELADLRLGVELPRNGAQVFAFGLADAEGVLRVKAYLAISIDNLRMKRKYHVLL